MSKRKVKEWIGSSPDTAVPPRVRLRVFEAHGGRCYLSGRKIQAGEVWDIEHKVALSLGGENRENNLAPALRQAHMQKTKDDRAQLAKDERVRKKHLGIYKARNPMPGSRGSGVKKKIDGTVVRRGE